MLHKIQATGALLFVSCIALWGLAPYSILFLDDQAFSMQLGKLILDGISPLTGLPSHLGARHIGPLYIWFMGGVLFLARADVLIANYYIVIVKLLGVALSGYLTYLLLSAYPERVRWRGASITILYFVVGGYLWVLRVDWANNLLLVTSAIALLVTYRAIQRGAKYWPVVLLAFSVLLQNHLSSAPLIAGLGVGLLLSWRELRIRTNYYLALVSLLVLWFFPLMYEFLYESNFYSLLTTHSTSSSERAGIQAALAVLSDRAFLPVLAVGILLFFGALRESPKTVREFWLAIILGLVFFTVALFRLQPPLHVYYAYCLLPIFPIFLGFCYARFGTSVFVLLAIYAVLNINPVVVEPTHSLTHAQEVAQIIQSNSTSTPKIRINKADGLRVNSIYHFLPGNTFGRMMYSRRFKEFPFVKDENGHSLRSAGSQGFYLTCKNPEKPFSSEKWQVAAELSLETCSTCTGCKLLQLTRR